MVSQAAARVMVDQGRGGKIVNLASQAGRRGEALALGYCASKAALISMTQSLALALAVHKINVNTVARVLSWRRSGRKSTASLRG